MEISAWDRIMEMGSDEQILSSGRVVTEYATSKARLASLIHEIASIAETYAGIADHIRKAHIRAFGNAPGMSRIPQPERLQELVKEAAAEYEKKSGLAVTLHALGVDVEADSGYLDPKRKP
jgi:hypothetical protein